MHRFPFVFESYGLAGWFGFNHSYPVDCHVNLGADIEQLAAHGLCTDDLGRNRTKFD